MGSCMTHMADEEDIYISPIAPRRRGAAVCADVPGTPLLYVIHQNHETGERTLGLMRWGLIHRQTLIRVAAQRLLPEVKRT
jgi:hypothetical protein